MKHGHPAADRLALYAGGDLGFAAAWRLRWHVRGCPACAAEVARFRQLRRELASAAAELPPGLNWERLAAEMTGNIRVGLAAAQAIQRPAPPARAFGWRPAAAFAGAFAVICAAWWLNAPPAVTQSLARVAAKIARWETGPPQPEAGVVVEATLAGVEVRENGSALVLSSRGLRPVAVSVRTRGSAEARFVDNDTGQVTITSVYVQD
jgi:anti-sigma factor RsiW